MKRILIAGLAALAFAATTSSGSAMPRVPADTLSDSADAIVQVRGGHGHGHGGHMHRGGRGHHYGWARGRHRGW
jgi:hypothetical protein